MKFNLIRLRANIMLFVTAFIWGVTFVAQKSAMDFLGPFMFNGLRCLFGSLSLFLLYFIDIKTASLPENKKIILRMSTGLAQALSI